MNWVSALRREIGDCARQYAERHNIPYYLSLGQSPTVIFEPYNGNALHGNFLASSYQAILAHPLWKARLQKRHPKSQALPADKQGQAKELDSSNSSDTLLMNVFCYPGIEKCHSLARLFGQTTLSAAEFGVSGHVPLVGGETDTTKIDMRLEGLLIEAKLTEPDFTSKSKARVATYRDFEAVFEASALPQDDDEYFNYQLIRNVLAAFACGSAFFLICDARRPDLLRSWWEVVRSIKLLELRSRCNLVLWQEIAVAAPAEIREFLREKYGMATKYHGTGARAGEWLTPKDDGGTD